jgi:hypothetical protein
LALRPFNGRRAAVRPTIATLFDRRALAGLPSRQQVMALFLGLGSIKIAAFRSKSIVFTEFRRAGF